MCILTVVDYIHNSAVEVAMRRSIARTAFYDGRLW